MPLLNTCLLGSGHQLIICSCNVLVFFVFLFLFFVFFVLFCFLQIATCTLNLTMLYKEEIFNNLQSLHVHSWGKRICIKDQLIQWCSVGILDRKRGGIFHSFYSRNNMASQRYEIKQLCKILYSNSCSNAQITDWIWYHDAAIRLDLVSKSY